MDRSGLPGPGWAPQAQAGEWTEADHDLSADDLQEEAWREITVAEGSQGPRSYMFSAQVRPTCRRKPGEIHWAIYRRNLDGSEPRYYLSNATEDTPLETLAYVGGSRWRIETEFETEKSDVGLDEYETRTWAGWNEPATGLGGKRCPGSRGRRCTGWCERCCPGNGSGRMSCCDGWWAPNIATSGPAALTRDAAAHRCNTRKPLKNRHSGAGRNPGP